MYTIGNLAKLTGVNLESIRYFERIGLLKPAERTEAGHRLFAPEHVERLLFIRHARDMGFSQDDVRTLLRLSDGELTSCGEVKDIASAHLDSIRQRIEKLQRLELLLASTVTKCSGGKVPTCPVIQALTDSES
jgi:MerR family mercuric resistance operon transcriptional regulator